MEIDDDRKILVFPGSGTEVAKPEVPGRVEGGVGSGNAVDWFVGRGNFEVDKLHERAVDGAIPAKACVRDGVEGGKQEPDLPWNLRRSTEFAAGSTGHFYVLERRGEEMEGRIHSTSQTDNAIGNRFSIIVINK